MTDIQHLIFTETNEALENNIEYPAGTNMIKYNAAFYGEEVHGKKYPWNSQFQWYCMDKCGLADYYCGGNKISDCTKVRDYYKVHDQLIVSGFQPGDFIFWNFGEGASEHVLKPLTSTCHHVSLCICATKNCITTIDGNSSMTSNYRGGTVTIRTRLYGRVVCGARPWDDSNFKEKVFPEMEGISMVMLDTLKSGSFGAPVRNLQKYLSGKGYFNGNTDGVYGAETSSAVKKFQADHQMYQDGICDAETWRELLMN